MAKHETPPFRMRVEGGRLAPVAAWDQERLSTFRNGSELTVQISQQKNRKLERKYWSIMHEVIKNCPVKQRTADDLHKAIRLKLGVVDAYFTVEGKLRVDVKSTTGMDDPEYQRFFDDAMGLLHELTGVDVDTLRKEAADVGEDDHETSPEAPRPESNGSGDPAPDAAAGLSEDQESGQSEAGAGEADHGNAAAPASPDAIKRMLMEEAIDNMLRDALSDPAAEQVSKVDKLETIFKQPENLSEFPEFVRVCAETARRIAGKPSEKARAREYLMGRIPA